MARDGTRDGSQLTEEEVTALWSPLGRGQKDPRADRATLRAHALAQIAQSARGSRRARRLRPADPRPAELRPVELPPVELPPVELPPVEPRPVELRPVDLPRQTELAHGSQSTPLLDQSGAAPFDRWELPSRRPVGSRVPLRSPLRPQATARPARPVASIALLLLAVCLWSLAYSLAWIELDVSEHVRSAWHDLADVVSAAASSAP